MKKQLCCVVLASEGKSPIGGNLPKVMHSLCGIPLLGHVLKTVESMGIQDIVLVTRDKSVEDYAAQRATIAYQGSMTGSAGGLFAAKDFIEKQEGDVLIVYGDRPFLKSKTLKDLLAEGEREGAAGALLSVFKSHPGDLTRVVRGAGSVVIRTPRWCEILPQEEGVREFLAGAYYFRKTPLLETLEHFQAENPAYCSIPEVAGRIAQFHKVMTLPVSNPQEVEKIRSLEDLAVAELRMQETLLEEITEERARVLVGGGNQ
jgi:bifunctional UDP-N-acetylglucosamine pyrophosphorylase / glucosamine-1-phosphate N-acetyltransferase